MELILPALIIFLLAFTGLSIGIIFGRKGISGSCSSNEAKLLDIQCFCGQDSSCSESCSSAITISAVCADGDVEKCRQIQADFERRTGQLTPPG
ncbi:hypothetical protein SAMN05660420_03168 [Desulfuromusa kysingii]|uniref:(Na+)-NQR maturation NqrM n=1 Tax=Desulfuromusa kysingii TaxID=37625 RepID=A0A1H4DZT5_9BACT|nr:hypothetical protein [Desulfuromusa kysingii]SEA78146.1 hypothetical protein SAMN05660420_03168 [Desulfuromusa kysingii]